MQKIREQFLEVKIPQKETKMQTTIFKQDNKEVIQEGNHFFIRVTEGNETFESGDFNTLESAKKSLGIKPTTEETNKIIAEFMGFKERLFTDSKGVTTKTYSLSNPKTSNGLPLLKIHKEKSLSRYSSDWNWLMEVVEKIESLGAVVEIRENVCYIETSPNDYYSELEETKIEATYKAVIKFIKWYNENGAKNN